MKRRAHWLAVVLTSMAITIPLGASVFWGASIDTDTSSWSIYRQSSNRSLDVDDYINGTISPVEVTSRGRVIEGLHSRYAHIDTNDILLQESTSAKEGRLITDEVTYLRSYNTANVVRTIDKPSGSPVYTFNFFEAWPAILASRRDVAYSGAEINDRDMFSNNLDNVGSSFLYGKELTRSRVCGLTPTKMNATVEATDDAILSYSFMPTKNTIYQEDAKSSGLARLKYRQASSDQLSWIRGRVSVANEGDEVFLGDYNLNANLRMRSAYENNTATSDAWLGFCYQDPQEIVTATDAINSSLRGFLLT